jgi:hypothetical protein
LVFVGPTGFVVRVYSSLNFFKDGKKVHFSTGNGVHHTLKFRVNKKKGQQTIKKRSVDKGHRVSTSMSKSIRSEPTRQGKANKDWLNKFSLL